MSKNEEKTSRDVPRFKSSLEDVDFAVYKFLDEIMDIRANTNKGFKKVPVIWSGSERAHNIKNDGINRDKSGMIILPGCKKRGKKSSYTFFQARPC